MASARLIRSASKRRVRILTDPRETEPLLGSSPTVPRARRFSIATAFSELIPEEEEEHTFHPYPFSDLPVYDNMWRIRKDILDTITDPYTLEQIRSPRLTTTVVRPMLNKYFEMNDISIVFCLLVNRMQFLRNQSFPGHYQSVNTTRAILCEVLAARLLRLFDDASSGPNGLLLLTNIVISGFDPFQKCPADVANYSSRTHWSIQHRGGYEKQMTALEVAILSESKIFLSAPACQKVVDAIYKGRVVYTPISFVDILPDHYKHKPISIYDPRKHDLLNQYRLAVPRIRNIHEVGQFMTLLALYFWVMTTKDPARFTPEELIFCIYTFGWGLDQLASMLEHGWEVYSQNLWSFLDVTFVGIFVAYFVLRMHGLSTDKLHISQPALDILAMGAPFIVPRLAFNLFSENLVFVSLRDMMASFILLTLLAVWSFLGFFLSMWWLSGRYVEPLLIGKWMIWVWFGLDGTGISESGQFHQYFGPLLMVTFALLGNTLFLTILVSTLSNTFSKIQSRSNAEIQFRRAVLTFEGVKCDTIFSYPPPFNILALAVLLPLKPLVSPRWFHKINVAAIRFINAPYLLLIAWYERRFLWPTQKAGELQMNTLYQNRYRTGRFHWFRVHGDIEAVFDNPPEDMKEDEPLFRDGLGNGAPVPALAEASRTHDGPRVAFREDLDFAHPRTVSPGPWDDPQKALERRLGTIEAMLSKISSTIEDDDKGRPDEFGTSMR